MTEVQEQEFDTDRVLTVPNVLSFIRLLAVPVFVWFILARHDLWAVGMLAVFGATDWVDGWIARRFKQRSPLGAKLDPVADRLYILLAVIAMTIRGVVPWWFTVILVLRDAMLVGLLPSLRKSGQWAVPVKFVGKAATMALLVAFPLVLLGASDGMAWAWAHWIGWILAVVGAVLYWWAGFGYLRDVVEMSRERRALA